MNNLTKTFVLTFLLSLTSIINGQENHDSAAIERISQYLENGEQNGLSGALLISRAGQIIFNEAFGMANKDTHLKNTSKTVFDVGSVSKQFTATAILKLEEQGKLKVEDVLSQYFFNLPIDKKNISIHQLLIHSAGIPRDNGKHDFDLSSRDEYFDQLFASELTHTPGTIHRYSNAGYSILARIIEIVSGQSYESFLNEYLFQPAGMMFTGYLLPKWENCSIASGYTYNVINTGTMIERYQRDGKVSWSLMGNGGINSTQEDMFKWYLALRSNKVLSKAYTKKLTTPYILEFEGETSYYAYGWVIFKTPRGTDMVAHDGSNATFFYDFRWLPEEDVAILYATNAFSEKVGGIAWRVDKMFFDETYLPKPIEENFITTLLTFTENYEGPPEKLGSSIKESYGNQIDKPFYLNRLSGIYSRNNKIEKAIVIAELNVELFPNNGNIWDSLGQAYYDNGHTQKALEAFERAVILDPDNSYARDMLTKLNIE